MTHTSPLVSLADEDPSILRDRLGTLTRFQLLLMARSALSVLSCLLENGKSGCQLLTYPLHHDKDLGDQIQTLTVSGRLVRVLMMRLLRYPIRGRAASWG